MFIYLYVDMFMLYYYVFMRSAADGMRSGARGVGRIHILLHVYIYIYIYIYTHIYIYIYMCVCVLLYM